MEKKESKRNLRGSIHPKANVGKNVLNFSRWNSSCVNLKKRGETNDAVPFNLEVIINRVRNVRALASGKSGARVGLTGGDSRGGRSE